MEWLAVPLVLMVKRPVVLGFQTAEKTYLTYQLEVTSKGGHASLPEKDNAIYRLAAGLGRLAAHQFPIEMNETTRLYFERSAALATGQQRADMLAVAKTQPDMAAAARLADSSIYYNALLRTTCVATMLSAGHAENAAASVNVTATTARARRSRSRAPGSACGCGSGRRR